MMGKNEEDEQDDKNSGNHDCNISFFLEEDNTEETDMHVLLEELENPNCVLDLNTLSCYEKNTCKELMLICEYYGFAKEAKANKYKKDQIIFLIIVFESNPENLNTVYQRKNLWFYMNELKNDKIMKKYVLW